MSSPLITFLQPSFNDDSLLSEEAKPGLSTPQATIPMIEPVNNFKPCTHKAYNEVNNNTNNGKCLPRKHQQTVRFIAGHKIGKCQLKSSISLASTEESIVSDVSPSPSYGKPQHVRMMVNLKRFCHLFIWLSAHYLPFILVAHFSPTRHYTNIDQ